MRNYRTFNDYVRERFGGRVQKVSLDAGFTCPNRDGSKAVGGCIYCNNETFNFSPETSLRQQLVLGMEKARRRYGARRFMAYFQAYTNTYGSPDQLYETYSTILEFPEIVGLSIGTRPDCVPDEVLDVIRRFVPTHDVWVEYGLESSSDDSLRRMNRAHDFTEFRDAVERTAGRGIHIASHIIVGFPWEPEETMLQTAHDLASLPIEGIKIHNLYIAKETPLERMYRRSQFPLMSMEEYAEITAKIMRILPPEMIYMRLTAECPVDMLIAPDWCNHKTAILQAIDTALHRQQQESVASPRLR